MEFCQCDRCGHVVFAPVGDADDACPSCKGGQLDHLGNREAGGLLMRRQLLKALMEVTEEQISIAEDRAMGADIDPCDEQCLDGEADALWAGLVRLRRRTKGA